MTLHFFLQTKLKQSVVSFHLHSHRTPNQLDPLLKLPSSPSVPSLRRKYPNFSSPAILQHVELSSNELSSTRSHCFFHRTTNWTLNSQVSGVAIQLRLRYSRSLKPCELQKPIPNHQSSFCLICLPLLTLSIIRSSCPPSHHWTSLRFHFADDTQLYLSFRPDDPTVAARISGCLADISAWMKEHHLQLNLVKTELLVFPATPTLQHDFTIQLGSSTITPSALVRNLGAIFDDQLTFKKHIAKTARSCKFGLHNIRKIRPFLTEHAAQLLVQALVISRLGYCNALLAGLPSNTIKPLQMIHDWSSMSRKEPMLHLSLSPCTGYQLQIASSSRH